MTEIPSAGSVSISEIKGASAEGKEAVNGCPSGGANTGWVATVLVASERESLAGNGIQTTRRSSAGPRSLGGSISRGRRRPGSNRRCNGIVSFVFPRSVRGRRGGKALPAAWETPGPVGLITDPIAGLRSDLLWPLARRANVAVGSSVQGEGGWEERLRGEKSRSSAGERIKRG